MERLWRHGLAGMLILATTAVHHAGEASPAPAETGLLRITYVGNEGFLIEGGGSKVLIDGAYRGGVPGYVVIPRERQQQMNYAKAPFAGIDVILATHHHADHFDPRAVGRLLEANQDSLFVSTNQAVDRMRKLSGFASVMPRVRGVLPEEGKRDRFRRNDVVVEMLNLHHGRGGNVENLGFLVEIGGKKLLHIGDTWCTVEELQANGLVQEEIDIAFLPYWYLEGPDAPREVQEAIGPGQIVAMHIPPPEDPKGYLESSGGFEGLAQQIEARFPGAMVFRQEMETHEIR